MIRFISVLLWVFSLSTIYAQSREELEIERNRIIQEIELAQLSLEETSQNKNEKLRELQLLNDKISKRKSLIGNLKNSVLQAEQLILQNEESLINYESQLANIKDQYGKLLRITYLKKLSTNEWAYLLSVENLNQAFLRWRYMKQFERYCADKAAQIKNLQKEIDSKIQNIEEFKSKQSQLLQNESSQISKLQKDQNEKNKILSELKKDESQLRANLVKAKKEREKLNFAIENAIVSELNRRKNELEEADIEVLSEHFSDNKGKLPWPLTNGYVSGKFGVQNHPTLKGVQINNNGIDIQSNSGAVVLAVHPGKVIGIAQIPGYDNMVIVQHGDFYTVYSRLSRVLVQKEKMIKIGAPIGNISDSDSILHFEIWKNKSKENPEKWLREK
jgi:septal ring factor EnvC (AmiA/AmiB activator)